jgi:hypothetical protein
MTTSHQTGLDLFNGYVPTLPDKQQLTEVFKRIADFHARTLKKPDSRYVDKTPDGKADTLVISYIENRLDELYSGLWNALNFKFQVIANELAGSITLEVFHPECGVWLKRDGAAGIQIMVDAPPQTLSGQDRNNWYLNLANKKPNCIQMQLPRLKAECLKNAAKSLGITFGRELNRKKSDKEFNPDVYDDDTVQVREEIIELCKTSTLPKTELDIMVKMAADNTTPITRLEGIKSRLIQNQK